MSVKLITSLASNIFLFGFNGLFQLFSIVINFYLITLQRVLLSLLIIFGEIPVSRHEPMSERKGLFIYRIIRNYVNLIQYVRNWLGRWYNNDILKAAPIPILYEDDEIDESFFSSDKESVSSVFGDSECES
uniref:Bestrophin homolog n=1 Tax=Strongyloides papillosus TaxID=174720 RepID=A0A0N5CB42_STREA